MSDKNYSIFDEHGMIIAKGDEYSPEMNGALNDIILKCRQIAGMKESNEILSSIDIIYDKATITTRIDNDKKNLICMISNKN